MMPRPPLLLCLSEGLLRGVDDVEEAVLVHLAVVQISDGGSHRGQRRLVGQEEEGLVRVQAQATSEKGEENVT